MPRLARIAAKALQATKASQVQQVAKATRAPKIKEPLPLVNARHFVILEELTDNYTLQHQIDRSSTREDDQVHYALIQQEITAGNLPTIEQMYDVIQKYLDGNGKTRDVDKMLPRESRINDLRAELLIQQAAAMNEVMGFKGAISTTPAPANYSQDPENSKAQWKYYVKENFYLADGKLWNKGTLKDPDKEVIPAEQMYWRFCWAHIARSGEHLGRDGTYKKYKVNKHIIADLITIKCPGCAKRQRKCAQSNEKKKATVAKKTQAQGGEEDYKEAEWHETRKPKRQRRHKTPSAQTQYPLTPNLNGQQEMEQFFPVYHTQEPCSSSPCVYGQQAMNQYLYRNNTSPQQPYASAPGLNVQHQMGQNYWHFNTRAQQSNQTATLWKYELDQKGLIQVSNAQHPYSSAHEPIVHQGGGHDTWKNYTASGPSNSTINPKALQYWDDSNVLQRPEQPQNAYQDPNDEEMFPLMGIIPLNTYGSQTEEHSSTEDSNIGSQDPGQGSSQFVESFSMFFDFDEAAV